MSKAHIGVQMSTVVPILKECGLYEAIRKCTQAGLYHFEVSQVPMTAENVAALKRAEEELGARISAVTALVSPMQEEWAADMDNLEEDFDKIVADCRTLGCTVVRISMLPYEALGSREGALAFAAAIDGMGVRLKEQGIDLYFHTHHAEFTKYDGQYVLDIIRDNAPHIGFELDIHWIQRGGANPVEVIRDYKGRVRVLHLKDYRINGRKYAQEGFGADIIEYAEVGEGNLPIKDCIESGLASGCEYFFIEQDLTYGRTPFESLKISHDNLVQMGYGEMFLPD